MIQSKHDLEEWYKQDDPWAYETTFDDQKRKQVLLNELPDRKYKNVLDIGCGHGFVTRDLPGKKITGIDISEQAVKQATAYAKKKNLDHISYRATDLFALPRLLKQKFDLIIITGVMYPQYIGTSNQLVYVLMDELLEKNGVLATVHVDEWYTARFPFLQIKEYFYHYRQFEHRLEVYVK